jgi:hypothetical protein
MQYAAQVATQPGIAFVVAVVLFGVGRVIILRVAHAEQNPWLVKVLTIALLVHLLGAPLQIWVVDHLYHGVSDWNRYTHVGSTLAGNFRHFNFTLAGANVRQIVNDGSVSIATGVVMAIVGINLTATFLVFSFLSFVGSIFFYRAFTTTFPRADHRRYALLVFFLPSLVFWTSDVSKESIMMLALGMVAYGAAKLFARQHGAIALIIPGAVIGYYIRPNELLLVTSGFAVGMMLPSEAVRRRAGGLRRVASLAFLVALVFISWTLTLKYIHGGGGTLSLQQVNANNSGNGFGFGSSGIPYSNNPATFPRDVYNVLFNPLVIKAHGNSQRVAGLENLVLIGIILASIRQLRILPRAAFARPYVMMCVVYSVAFIYTFAALGNLGLIERERVMLLPFFLVPFCIPRGPKGAPPRYPWELRRRDRLRLRALLEQMQAKKREAERLAANPLAAADPVHR